MGQYISKSLWLLFFSVVICCLIYPAILWAIGQTIFPFQANGSILQGPDGKAVGSLLVAQPFTKDEYFQPRPSAASYDASASASSTLAASNYMLRNRVADDAGSDRQVQERRQSRAIGGAGYRSVVPAGQVRRSAAYRRAVGRPA